MAQQPWNYNQQLNQYAAQQQSQLAASQNWRQDQQRYQAQLGFGGLQQADASNPYQAFLRETDFKSWWNPNDYSRMLAEKQRVAAVHGQLSQEQQALQSQLKNQHQSQYLQQYTQHLQQTQQQASYADRYMTGAQKFHRAWDQLGHQDQQEGPVNPFNPLNTRNPFNQVHAPDNFNALLEDQKRKGLIAQNYGDMAMKPAEIEFHKLSAEVFQQYTLYYKPDCPHSINLLAHLSKQPTLDHLVIKLNVNEYFVQGLQGVPTVVDGNRQFLGDEALRWVNEKTANNVVGMDVDDVSAAPTSGASGPGENYSLIHSHYLDMPQITSLDALETRQSRGPQIDSLMQLVDGQRKTWLAPYADMGGAPQQQPAQQQHGYPQQQQRGYPQQQQRGYPQQQGFAQQSLRPQMNGSQKGNFNSGYEMDRNAFLGEQGKQLQSRRYM